MNWFKRAIHLDPSGLEGDFDWRTTKKKKKKDKRAILGGH